MNSYLSFRTFNSNGSFRLLGTLLLMSALPTLYQSVRIYFLGALPVDWGYNIASQLSWVGLFFEVVQEAFMLPLFFLLGQALHDRNEFVNRVQTGLTLTIVMYGILTTLLAVNAPYLTRFMAQKPELISATVTYIRLETIGMFFSAPLKFCSLIFLSLKYNRALLTILLLQMILSIAFDTLLISNTPISFKLGVNGIAWTNIVVNIFLLMMSLVFLRRERLMLFRDNFKWSFSWFKGWIKIGGYSGLESLVRNLAFMLMIVRLMNEINEQSAFWLANNFIWGWLLLPILALGELIKRNSAESPADILRLLPSYVIISLVVILLWLATSPLWYPFLQSILGIPHPEKVLYLVRLSILFYVVFAFNNIIDSIFYGLGRTDLMLLQSLLVNVLLYGSAFILYTMGFFHPSLDNITMLFGIVIIVDAIITFVLFYRLRPRLEVRNNLS
ncbi:MAG: hypothetical protein JNM22_04645 [Saprospiraceae bacterium]|nr:hypothetical protein [Saprospiraceae bacterium]